MYTTEQKRKMLTVMESIKEQGENLPDFSAFDDDNRPFKTAAPIIWKTLTRLLVADKAEKTFSLVEAGDYTDGFGELAIVQEVIKWVETGEGGVVTSNEELLLLNDFIV